jgi:hypothetical protein
MAVMGPVGVVAAAGVRRRWPTYLLLAGALGLAGAVVLASVAGSRRGRSALDDFVDHYRPGTIQAYVNPTIPLAQQERILDRMAAAAGDLPSASSAVTVVRIEGRDGVPDDLLVANAYLQGEPLAEVNRALVVDGEQPLDEDEVAINERLADRQDLHVGDDITVDVFAAEDIDRVGNGEQVDPVDHATLRIGLVMRSPFDLARSPLAQPGTLFESDESRMFLGPSFWAEHGGAGIASYGMQVVVDTTGHDRDDVAAAMRAAGGEQVLVNNGGPEDLAKLGPVGDGIDLESNALLGLAAVVLVFGLAVLGAAAVRATRDDEEDRATFRAIGLTRGEVARSVLVRGLGLSVVATVVALGGAVALSGLFPIGVAREAEIDPGIDLDAPVLLLGGAVFAALVLTRLAFAALTPSTGRARRVRTSSPLPLTPGGIGARLAVDGLGRAGRGSARVALATAIAGVVAVAAAATFAASLDHLQRHPALQGWNWDVVVGNYSDRASADGGRGALDADPDVASYEGYNWNGLTIDGQDVIVAEIDHPERVTTVLEGRAPASEDEIAVGRGTLDLLGKDVGDTVEVAASGAAVPATIVGVVVAPATIAEAMDLDSGAVSSFGFNRRVFADQPDLVFPESFLVRFDRGVDRDEALDRLREDFPGTVLGPMEPTDLGNLERVRSFPYLLAGLLGALALVSTAVSLTTAARRRRRDLAVLRALGMARQQVRRLVAGEASTMLVLALVVGVPLGVAAGRVAWTLAADGLGSEIGPLVPLTAILAAGAALLLLVNVYGQGLATVTARRRPGADLREE